MAKKPVADGPAKRSPRKTKTFSLQSFAHFVKFVESQGMTDALIDEIPKSVRGAIDAETYNKLREFSKNKLVTTEDKVGAATAALPKHAAPKKYIDPWDFEWS
jgi:hypothetical protein